MAEGMWPRKVTGNGEENKNGRWDGSADGSRNRYESGLRTERGGPGMEPEMQLEIWLG